MSLVGVFRVLVFSSVLRLICFIVNHTSMQNKSLLRKGIYKRKCKLSKKS
ncbi:unnamed protein product, partial [Arabidopsis halleri]